MYTTNEVAEKFGVSLKTVQWWCRERWSGKKIGRDYMLTEEDLEEFAYRRKGSDGQSHVAQLVKETMRSLPTIYKAIKKAGCTPIDGVYRLTESQLAEVKEQLKEK